MKKLLCAALALGLALGLSACGGGSSSAAPKDYAQIIAANRDEDINDSVDIVTKPEDDTFGVMELYGLDPEKMERYAISISPINMRAYGVMIVLPTQEGKDEVKKAMQGFIEKQVSTFEYYLPDQYEIAQQAQLVETPAGELVLVMCEDADKVLSAIEKALKA